MYINRIQWKWIEPNSYDWQHIHVRSQTFKLFWRVIFSWWKEEKDSWVKISAVNDLLYFLYLYRESLYINSRRDLHVFQVTFFYNILKNISVNRLQCNVQGAICWTITKMLKNSLVEYFYFITK